MTPSADLGAAPRAEAEDLIGPAGRELVTEDDSPLPQAVGYVSTLTCARTPRRSASAKLDPSVSMAMTALSAAQVAAQPCGHVVLVPGAGGDCEDGLLGIIDGWCGLPCPVVGLDE